METLWQDLRYGARILAKKPGFSLIAVITLALGIGSSTAIFSVVNAVLLRQLPYRDADRFIFLSASLPNGGADSFSLPELEEIRAQSQSLEALAGEMTQSVNLTGTAQPERVRGGYVTANYFEMFKLTPLVGRTFALEEGKPGAERVVIVKESFWRRRLNADANLTNKTLILNAEPYNVIGVVPNTFRSPQDPDAEVWMVARHYQGNTASREFRFQFGLGYLKPGIAPAQAQAELNTISERLAQAYPKEQAGRGIKAELMHELSVRGIRRALLTVLAAVGFILLIACANLANLMLSRGAGRMKEMTLRAALGASRWRLMRQLLTEALLLSLTGGALGLLVAVWSLEPLLKLSPGIIPFGEARLDPRVMLFTLAVSALTGVLSGLAPALQFGRPDLQRVLKEGGHASGESASWRWARGGFAVAQIALSFILLVGAGLLVRSFYKLLQVDPGFNTENLLTLEYRLPRTKYATSETQWNFHRQVIERVSEVPGVQSASLARGVPFSFNGGQAAITLPDRERPARGKEPRVLFHTVTPGYFATMQIPFVRGRLFNDGDRGNTQRVYLINRTMAEQFWPPVNGQAVDPIGKQVQTVEDGSTGTIIGIVGDAKHYWLHEEKREPQLYSCYSQMPGIFATVIARTSVEPLSLGNTLRQAVWKVDPDQPVWKIRTVEYLLRLNTGDRRFFLALMGIFAVLAMVLASIGLYGVMAYAVSQRTHEIGIRMALGARSRDVLKLVVGHGMLLALIGVLIGLCASLGLTWLIKTLLFGVETTDSLTFSAVTLLLITVALLACYVPARRATRVDPMIALRCE